MTHEFAGARWWKFDFHTHTPASRDYGKGPAQEELKECTPREWLLGFMRGGIGCVAITDHNTGEWIDRLKLAYSELQGEAIEDFRPLHLFPGIELSVHGDTHVLAIFGPEKTTADIDTLLGAVGLPAAQKGQLESCTGKTFEDVVAQIHQAGGLAIPAHADRENGLFTALNGPTLQKALSCQAIEAMETVDRQFSKPQVYTDRKLAWTEVLGSDSHHPTGNGDQRFPGSHFTWVKMGEPTIEGLRLALLDGTPLSTQRSDSASGNPNHHARLVIEEIQIREARYAGRDGPLCARFSPWLSTLIGGRGTGKSTVAEALRIGLRREGELPEELRSDFDRFASVPKSRGDRGALTEETEIQITLRKDGMRYRAIWRQDRTGQEILEEDTEGKWIPSAGKVLSRFPVRIFSQKQVFALSEDPGALLRLIDEAPQVDRAGWTARWQKQEARFLSLRSQARELGARLSDRKRVEGELADARRQLAVFEEGGHRDALLRYQRVGRQRRAFDDRDDGLQRAEEQVSELARELEPSDVRTDDFRDGDPTEDEALALLREAAENQRGIAERLETLAGEFAAFREDWKQRIGSSTWAAQETAVTEAYRELVARLEAEGVEDPTAYGGLVQRRHSLERQLADVGSTQRRKMELETEAEKTLAGLEELRVELSKSRSKFLQEVLAENQFVQMSVVPFGEDSRKAEPEFRRCLGRDDGRLGDDILSEDGTKGLLAELYGTVPGFEERQGGEVEEAVRQLKAQLVSAAEGSDLEGRTKWFHNHLHELSPEQVDRLQLWWPEDGLRVAYQRPGAGFVSIEQGSPGQKSAAILAFVLSYGQEPIILDQPEDDLDNHLIYDLIVSQIRENKRQRQVIVVTHNPNIVVNGDAEMVIAMDHRKGQCVVLRNGTGCLQEQGVRDEICRVMEGGRRAFKARYRRLVEERPHA